MHTKKKQKTDSVRVKEPEHHLSGASIAKYSKHEVSINDQDIDNVLISDESSMKSNFPEAKKEDYNIKDEIDYDIKVDEVAQMSQIEAETASVSDDYSNNESTDDYDELDSDQESITTESIKTERLENAFNIDEYPAFSNNRGRYYCCHVCDKKMTDHLEYFNHLEAEHKLTYKLTRSKNFKTEPILEDPDFYCRSCEKKYSSVGNYRMHLQWVHHMMIKSPKVSLDRILLPPENNSQYYCGACDTTYDEKALYYKHLNSTHKISSFGPNANPDLVPDMNNKRNYCRACDTVFRNPNRFRIHLNDTHNIAMVRHPDLSPNWYDESNYCNACELDLLSRQSFHDHCVEIHNCDAHGIIRPNTVQNNDAKLQPADVSTKPNRNLTPDPLDPLNYCKACLKTYKSKKSFQEHLKQIHSISKSAMLSGRKYHCSPCDRYFLTGASCQSHFRWVHASVPQPIINDPNHYCRTCKKTFDSQPEYHSHLQDTHLIDAATQLMNMSNQSYTGFSNDSATEPTDSASHNSDSRAQNPTQTPHITSNTAVEPPLAVKHVTITHGETIVDYIIPENDGRPRPIQYTDLRFPDPNDPTFYCRVCKSYKTSTLRHRAHCKQVHKMELQPYFIPFPYPDAEIDLENPDSYCARCDKIYTPFRDHLDRIHGIVSHRRRTIIPPTMVLRSRAPKSYE